MASIYWGEFTEEYRGELKNLIGGKSIMRYDVF